MTSDNNMETLNSTSGQDSKQGEQTAAIESWNGLDVLYEALVFVSPDMLLETIRKMDNTEHEKHISDVEEEEEEEEEEESQESPMEEISEEESPMEEMSEEEKPMTEDESIEYFLKQFPRRRLPYHNYLFHNRTCCWCHEGFQKPRSEGTSESSESEARKLRMRQKARRRNRRIRNLKNRKIPIGRSRLLRLSRSRLFRRR